ncbi:MAG: Gfo/Idh/MocA family oxidoreductase, partial [Planctomycetota bacterium]
MNCKLNRRAAIKSTLAVGAAVWSGTSVHADEDSPNNKLNVAFIGVGGRGFANVNGLKNQNVVALCDVDQDRGKQALGMFPKAKKFVDYREMYSEMGDKFDAVTVSTPDHSHAPASVGA